VRLLVEQVRVTGPSVQIHLRIPLDEPSPDDHTPSHPGSTKQAHRHASNQLRLRSLGGVHPTDPGPARAAGQTPANPVQLIEWLEMTARAYNVDPTQLSGPVDVALGASAPTDVTVHSADPEPVRESQSAGGSSSWNSRELPVK
jgi:hypothetical protein